MLWWHFGNNKKKIEQKYYYYYFLSSHKFSLHALNIYTDKYSFKYLTPI